VRGLNNPHKRDLVKFWLRDWKCDVVRLQETKLDYLDWRVIRSLWGNPYADWEVLDVVGTAGGVLLLWDKRVVEKLDSFVGRFLVSCLWWGSLMVLYGLALDSMVPPVMLLGRIFGWSSETFGNNGSILGVFLVISM
jgi:hypothetical protein